MLYQFKGEVKTLTFPHFIEYNTRRVIIFLL